MRTKYISVELGRKLGIEKCPNFHKSGSIKGMKELYYGKNTMLVRCGSYIYCVNRFPEIYYEAH